MSSIKIPNIPLTNMGLRTFLTDLSQQVQNNCHPCKGYSVAGDPSGRVLITATFDSVESVPYSLTLEIAPVAAEAEE